jgi:hypothetical protein
MPRTVSYCTAPYFVCSQLLYQADDYSSALAWLLIQIPYSIGFLGFVKLKRVLNGQAGEAVRSRT